MQAPRFAHHRRQQGPKIELYPNNANRWNLQVQELIIDYSDCGTTAPSSNSSNPFGDFPANASFAEIPSGKISSSFKKSNFTDGKVPQWSKREVTRKYPDPINGPETKKTPTTICTLQFVIPADLKPPVLFYYRLTNFYQNHRRYVKSLDTDQLKGEAVSLDTIKGSSCDPLRYDNATQRPYYPCGLIANSFFNDSFTNPKRVSIQNGTTDMGYEMFNKGIAWDSDKALYGQTKYHFSDIAVPPNWIERFPTGSYTADNLPPNLHENEEFQVWMRSAGLPTFSKLAMRNDVDWMGKGTYQLDIEMSKSIKSSIQKKISNLPLHTQLIVFFSSRFPRHSLWRHQSHHHLHADHHGREKPLPRHRLCRRRRDLHRPRGFVHYHQFDQT